MSIRSIKSILSIKKTMYRKKKGIEETIYLVICDTVGIIGALALAYISRFVIKVIPIAKGFDLFDYLYALPFATMLWLFGLGFVNLYDKGERVFSFDTFAKIFKGSVVGMVLLTAATFFYRGQEYSRLVLVLVFFYAVICISLCRYVLNIVILRAKMNGIGVNNALIIGTGKAAHALAEKISADPTHGLNLLGFISSGTPGKQMEIEQDRVLGATDEVSRIIKERKVKEVFIADAGLEHEELIKILLECEKEIVEFRIVPDFFHMMFTDLSVEIVNGLPFISLKESPLRGFNLIVKRLFDISGAAVGLAFFSVVVLPIIYLIKRESKGSAFYSQERMGINGEQFIMHKFRTMISDAEENTGPVFTSENDHRLTKVGVFLRKYNLDELPQLLNVLKGEMSLVGPRPERPYFVDKFREGIPRYMARHSVKSGITGWSQVNGLRQNTSMSERLKFDLYYIENWSFWFDVRILMITFLKTTKFSRRQPEQTEDNTTRKEEER